MTDASLMDADCTHGRAWYDCPECDELMAADPALNPAGLVEIGGQTMTQAQFDAARSPLLDDSPPGECW